MRGVAPALLALGGLAISALLLYLTVTPSGQAVLKSAINFVGDLVSMGQRAITLLLQFISISLSIMTVSFKQINTVSGLILFVFSTIGNFAVAFSVIVFISWAAEKLKNIIKPV